MKADKGLSIKIAGEANYLKRKSISDKLFEFFSTRILLPAKSKNPLPKEADFDSIRTGKSHFRAAECAHNFSML